MFIYANAALTEVFSGLLFGLREPAGIVSMLSLLSDVLLFLALCLTVSTTGKYLATNWDANTRRKGGQRRPKAPILAFSIPLLD